MFFTDIDTAAREAFGIEALYPLQKEVIRGILAGKRQLVLLPTGYGKSLCFLLPALMLKGATLVIYPLLALMQDQKRRMEQAGICAVELKGGQTKSQRAAALEALGSGKAQIVLANPEVLRNRGLVEALASCAISHIAIDEAHCVAEWGESFRPAYLELGRVISRLGSRRVTAFTATASPPVQERIQELLFGKGERALVVQGNLDRPNLDYRVCTGEAKRQLLLRLLPDLPRPLVVFCATRRGAEDTARLLAAFLQAAAGSDRTCGGPSGRPQGDEAAGREVRFYHAALTKAEKAACQDWFFKSSTGILCATCAYGMGVDKSNIRAVLHLDAPAKPEFFIQEAGRAGRDGKSALSLLLWSREDRRKAPAMRGYAEGKSCRRGYLLQYLQGMPGEKAAGGRAQAACSGCDICRPDREWPGSNRERPAGDRKRPGAKMPVPPPDAGNLVADWIRHNRRLYTQSEALPLLMEMLNEDSRAKSGVSTWESGDITALLRALKDDRRIRAAGMGSREQARLDKPAAKRKRQAGSAGENLEKNRLTRRLLRRHRRLIHRLRRLIRLLARGQERLQRVF